MAYETVLAKSRKSPKFGGISLKISKKDFHRFKINVNGSKMYCGVLLLMLKLTIIDFKD